jgi:hypothetical protein
MHAPPPRILGLLALPVLCLLTWWGLRERPDPLWLESRHLLRQPALLVADAPDSLQQLYARLHRLPYRPGDSTAWKLLMRPAVSNIEWTAFRTLVEALASADRNRLVVSGVTGTGSTKQSKRAALLLCGSPERLLQIDCAPQFDLDYHKKYIGQEDGRGQFAPGLLLDFWARCRQQPQQRFVAVVDNFDKINPETFFGPALWEALSGKKTLADIGGQTVEMPPNFHLVSVTHLGPGSIVEFNEEHFKRLGRQYKMVPNPLELLAVLRLQKNKPDLSLQQARAIVDSNETQRFLYCFLKINQLLQTRYGEGFQMGQGTGIRDVYTDAERPLLKRTVMDHLNALRPDDPLEESDFEGMEKTIRQDGLEPGTSFLARQLQTLHDTGYFVEISMVAATALLTALVGWWVFRRREQLIRHYGEQARQVYEGFEHQQIGAEAAARRLEHIKQEVDQLVLRRRLGYTEGLYFLAFVEDKVKRIEFARSVSENFLELFNAFMEDNVLTESEYLKLRQFLESIRHKIPEDAYQQFQKKVEDAYGRQLL